jgi:crotonobetainyl-CoA:carnitine CoA-transferase CaiB-like acyl-CoA transferase
MPLSDLRVVEVGYLPAASYCARIFADFGADVIKVEMPPGDPGRRIPPLVEIGGGEREGAFFGFLNVRKRSAVVDKTSPKSVATLHALLSQADVLVDSLTNADRAAHGIDHAEIRRTNPSAVIVATSWFGESGPYKDYTATDSVCRALAGSVHLIGPEHGPPIPTPDYQAGIIGGLTAFIAAMAVLQHRERNGGGRFEVSVLEAALAISDYNMALAWAAGGRDKRWGVNRFMPNFPLGVYPCKEGWIGITVVTPVQWRTFCQLMGVEDLAADPAYALNRDRLRDAQKLEDRYKAKFLEKTAEEWFQIALAARLPFVVVPEMADVLRSREHERRGAFERITHGDRTYAAPSSPVRLTGTPPRRNGQVPALGSQTVEWTDAGIRSGVAPAPARDGAPPPPLHGIRIIDLSMGWAGPLATRHLADLGADVIKVEACQYPDWWRGVDDRPIVIEQVLYEKSPFFLVMNRNKRGITLDLTTEDGVRLVKGLIAKADIVIENYSAGVLPKLGLDYPQLRAVNEAIIMVSMPAFAADGPFRESRAYGSTLEQASGLPSVCGLPAGPPAMNHIAYGDPISGLNAAAAVLIALSHRRRSGQGQRIDLSQVECMLPMVAPWIIEQSARGTVSPRLGTRHQACVPHGCFRCQGDDAWVLIAVTGDPQWRALCQVMGREDLARDPSLATPEGRRQREEELETAIAAWTHTRSADHAMRRLQEAGIAAGTVRPPYDLLTDPHLLERGFWTWTDRPFVDSHPHPAPAYRWNGQSFPVKCPAPTLGQHNEEVLRECLDLSPSELARLSQAGVIGTEAVAPKMRKARAAGGGRRAAEPPGDNPAPQRTP